SSIEDKTQGEERGGPRESPPPFSAEEPVRLPPAAIALGLKIAAEEELLGQGGDEQLVEQRPEKVFRDAKTKGRTEPPGGVGVMGDDIGNEDARNHQRVETRALRAAPAQAIGVVRAAGDGDES